MKKGRYSHVSFFMNECLYVAGGIDDKGRHLKDCEQYDVNTGMRIDNVHDLPFELVASNAAMSADSSFVIITGGLKLGGSYNKSILTFTVREGFKVLNSTSTKIGRFLGVCIPW